MHALAERNVHRAKPRRETTARQQTGSLPFKRWQTTTVHAPHDPPPCTEISTSKASYFFSIKKYTAKVPHVRKTISCFSSGSFLAKNFSIHLVLLTLIPPKVRLSINRPTYSRFLTKLHKFRQVFIVTIYNSLRII